MQLLKAINAILPALGEHPVTRVDVKHPTLAVIIPVIEAKLREALMRDWWFNTSEITLYPDTEGHIYVPTTTLVFIPRKVRATVRRLQLYNQDALNFIWTEPVEGRLKETMEFDELPESVASYVMYSALVQTYVTDIGLESVVERWDAVATQAEFLATNEHLQNMKYSTQKSSRYGRLRSAMRG